MMVEKNLETEKRIGEIYQDYESPEGYIMIVTPLNCYRFDPVSFFSILDRYANRAVPTKDVEDRADQLAQEEPRWKRWQERVKDLDEKDGLK